MNRALLFVAVATFCLISCGQDKGVDKDLAVTSPQVLSVAKVDPKAQKLEALAKAPSVGLDGMQTMIPAEIAGIKRSKFSMANNLGYATATADYEKGKKSSIHLVLYDCTGENGAAIYDRSYLSYVDKNEQGEKGYKKTIVLGDGKAIEKYDADTKVTTLIFPVKETVLMEVSGKNLSAEELKTALSQMNVKVSS